MDLHSIQAIALADVILYAEFDRATNGSRHYLCKNNSFGGHKAFNGGTQNSTLVELRGNKHQTMVTELLHRHDHVANIDLLITEGKFNLSKSPT